ncbi:MAG: DUF3822 family protein [Bacteroidota bacterium]
MALKIIGYYNEAAPAENTGSGSLFLEISTHELACLVKGSDSHEIEGFELFRLPEGQADWSDLFYELKTESVLLNSIYKEVHCYFNVEEALLIPANRYSSGAADDYLDLLYGETTRHDTRHETIAAGEGMVNAYRIRKTMNELVGRNFVLYQPHHSYSALLKDVLAKEEQADHFIKLQVYATHIIAAVVKNRQLQLIQSFSYLVPEDILYHLVNISHQFELDVAHSHLEISGMLDPGSVLHQQLQPLFGLISFDAIEPDGVFKSHNDFPLHYFTPYYKLVV